MGSTARIETIWSGLDNQIDLALLADETPVPLDAITRVTLALGGVTLDSAVLGFGAGQPFDLTTTATPSSGPLRGQTVDVLRLQLGTAAGLPAAGRYLGALTTYDPDHPNGLRWDDPIPVRVA